MKLVMGYYDVTTSCIYLSIVCTQTSERSQAAHDSMNTKMNTWTYFTSLSCRVWRTFSATTSPNHELVFSCFSPCLDAMNE